MDRFEAMAMLVKVTEAGSLSGASRELCVPLSTLSRKISELEALLGTRLLVRTTRKLSLTDACIAYVAAARRILEQVEEAEREVASEFTVPKGELVITAPIMFGRLHVLPVVAAFLAAFPQINVRLLLADRNLDLIDAHVDMAVRIGTLPDSSMVATRLGLMRTVVCASPAFLAGHGAPQAPEALLDMPCIRVETPMPSSGWQFRQAGAAEVTVVPVTPRLSVTTPEAAVQAAVLGVGIARVLHYQAAEAVRAGRLNILLERFEPDPAPVSIVHASPGQMPLKMRSFLDFAAPRLRSGLLSAGEGDLCFGKQ